MCVCMRVYGIADINIQQSPHLQPLFSFLNFVIVSVTAFGADIYKFTHTFIFYCETGSATIPRNSTVYVEEGRGQLFAKVMNI